MNQASFFCPQCNQSRLFKQETMNHVPHILAAVFLCGLWLPIWIIAAITYKANWHCQFCGFSDAPQYLGDPELRKREQQRNAERLEFRRQELLARGTDLTFGERAAYFIEDNKKPLLTVGGLALGLGAIVFLSTWSSVAIRTAATQQQAEQTAKIQAISVRRDVARNIELGLKKKSKDIAAYTAGADECELWITSKTLDEAFANSFQSPQNPALSDLRNAGFTKVRVNSGNHQTWEFNL
jgi:hypothetical protein